MVWETRMALVRFHGMQAQLTPFFGVSGPVRAKFWRTGIAFMAFAPFVFVGAVLTDTFIAGVHHNIYVIVAAEFLLTIAYVGLASVLRDKLKFNVRQCRLAVVVAFLILIPAFTVPSSFLYCGVLYLGASLSRWAISGSAIHSG